MKNKNCIYGAILGIIVIIVDQITKFLLINRYLTIIPNVLKFTYTENYGAAFGINLGKVIIVLDMLIIIGIIYFAKREKNSFVKLLPYILIISGSFGNLIDRTFRGYVIDFININLFNFPNFNIADICIIMGVLMIVISVTNESLKNCNIKERTEK